MSPYTRAVISAAARRAKTVCLRLTGVLIFMLPVFGVYAVGVLSAISLMMMVVMLGFTSDFLWTSLAKGPFGSNLEAWGHAARATALLGWALSIWLMRADPQLAPAANGGKRRWALEAFKRASSPMFQFSNAMNHSNGSAEFQGLLDRAVAARDWSDLVKALPALLKYMASLAGSILLVGFGMSSFPFVCASLLLLAPVILIEWLVMDVALSGGSLKALTRGAMDRLASEGAQALSAAEREELARVSSVANGAPSERPRL